MVSLAKQSVFFPQNASEPSQTPKKPIKSTETPTKINTTIEQDLCLVDLDSLLCLDQLKNAQIVAVLGNLGVKHSNKPADVIEFHIIKEFERVEPKPDDILIAYTIYLAYWHSQQPQIIDFDKLRPVIRLKTNVGFSQLINERSPIYTTPVYGNRLDLRAMFPSFEARCQFIEPIYMRKMVELQVASNKMILADVWRRFWTQLGLTENFTPHLTQTRMSRDELRRSERFGNYSDQLEGLIKEGQCYLINDYEFDLLAFYVEYLENSSDG
jgi:hypothetical protein